jgi:hypothetical protein
MATFIGDIPGKPDLVKLIIYKNCGHENHTATNVIT